MNVVALYTKLTFDVQKDLAPVALISRTPLSSSFAIRCCLSRRCRTSSCMRKARPGDLNYGTVGPGSITHVASKCSFVPGACRPRRSTTAAKPPPTKACFPVSSTLMDGTPNTAADLVNRGRSVLSLFRCNAMPRCLASPPFARVD